MEGRVARSYLPPAWPARSALELVTTSVTCGLSTRTYNQRDTQSQHSDFTEAPAWQAGLELELQPSAWHVGVITRSSSSESACHAGDWRSSSEPVCHANGWTSTTRVTHGLSTQNSTTGVICGLRTRTYNHMLGVSAKSRLTVLPYFL